MKVKELTFISPDFPEVLKEIATPPERLFVLGDNFSDLLKRPRVAIVGSRKVTPYGRAVTSKIAAELAKAGVVIVSGLAIGVDSVAHRAALEVGGLTMAVLPSGLDYIYPASHQALARQIVEQGGALITEYPGGSISFKQNFIARNRLVSGLSNIVLITEATEKSGTMHTARFALEQGREVVAVPGNITSQESKGANNLIKAGANLITSAQDVLDILGIKSSVNALKRVPKGGNSYEQCLLDLIHKGVREGDELLARSKLGVTAFNQTLTMLEIKGLIRALGANQWAIA